MKKFWALRYVFGMLLAFGLGVVLLVTAMMNYPMYAGIAVLLLIGWIVAIQPRVRKERERTDSLVEAAFQDSYSQLPNPPSMKVSTSYGYPAFEIQFRSKVEMAASASSNEVFKVAIDEIFKGYGPRNRPFSADTAIFFTYHRHLDEFKVDCKTT